VKNPMRLSDFRREGKGMRSSWRGIGCVGELFDGCAGRRCKSRSNSDGACRAAAWKHPGQDLGTFREALDFRIAYRKLPLHPGAQRVPIID
jgi:hypothetical protein